MRRPLLLLLLVTAFSCTAPAEAQDRAAQIEALLAKYHDFGLFNGTVLVADGGEVIYKKGFGEADMTWGVPNTPDTKFRIGSITKQFTAALVLQLVEKGRIDLDAPITTYLPDYPAAQGAHVTVHHLLTHTSGIPSYTSLPGFMEFTRDPYEPDSFLTVFSRLDLEFEPGSRYAYSNSGYFLLGVLIEHVTGQPYDVVLRERLLDPLGLHDTGYEHYGEIVEQMATGYVKTGGGYEHAAYLDTSIPYAAGMMYSTVEDLHRWNQALHRGEPFEHPGTLERMTTPYLNNYAYGLSVLNAPVGEDSVRTIAHGGGIFGFTTMLRYMPEEERTVIVLDNTEGSPGTIAQALIQLLYGQPVEEPRQPISDVLRGVIETEGVEAAVARYRALKRSAPDTYDFHEAQLNRLGYEYLRRGDAETAVRIFQLNVEAYPESWNPYDSLGEAYLAAGDRERAIENYQKALALNPASTSAKRALEGLGVETARERVAVPDEVLESYVGRYELGPNFVIAITRDGDQLYAQATGQPRFEIYPSSESRFYLEAVDAQLTFDRDENGEVVGLTLHQGGRNMPAKKIE